MPPAVVRPACRTTPLQQRRHRAASSGNQRRQESTIHGRPSRTASDTAAAWPTSCLLCLSSACTASASAARAASACCAAASPLLRLAPAACIALLAGRQAETSAAISKLRSCARHSTRFGRLVPLLGRAENLRSCVLLRHALSSLDACVWTQLYGEAVEPSDWAGEVTSSGGLSVVGSTLPHPLDRSVYRGFSGPWSVCLCQSLPCSEPGLFFPSLPAPPPPD